MADRKSVWIYIYSEKHDFDGPAFLVYARKADALAHAAETIKGIATAERTRYDWEPVDPNPGELTEILGKISENKLEEAVDDWERYRNEYDHDESVTIQEAQFFE